MILLSCEFKKLSNAITLIIAINSIKYKDKFCPSMIEILTTPMNRNTKIALAFVKLNRRNLILIISNSTIRIKKNVEWQLLITTNSLEIAEK